MNEMGRNSVVLKQFFTALWHKRAFDLRETRPMPLMNNIPVLICDDNVHTRRMVSEVLRHLGFNKVEMCKTGDELLKLTLDYHPRIVFTSSRVPGISGLEYTRLIRAGFKTVKRETSIIVMTNTPTSAFLEAAQTSGVDEVLVRPFAPAALTARIEAVLARPRRFIESQHYVGPCRRRRMVDEYAGPMRRFSDPLEEEEETPIWESEENRALVRECVRKISELTKGLSPTDRRKLREIYAAVQETEELADEMRDEMLASAARSFGRYITGIGASGDIDPEVIRTHIDSMQQLSQLGAKDHAEREALVAGLVKVVDKRLKGRTAESGQAA